MQLTRVPPLAAAALAALLAGCDSPQSPSERAPSITIDAARDVEPGDTVLVRLKAMAGATSPYPGLEIRLSVTGGGAISTDHVVTDPSGSASLQWILAATEDSQSVRAVAPSGAILALEPRWRVHAVELERPVTDVVVDSAFVAVRVLNRAGAVIARPVKRWIVATPDFDSLTVASFSNGRLDALTPGFVTIHAVSEGVAATPLRLRIAPRVAVLASFDQAAPAVAGDTVLARGYRLDFAGDLTIGGVHVETSVVDSTRLRFVVPPVDPTPCKGGAYLAAGLTRGIVHTPGLRIRREGELSLAPGELIRMGATRGGCIRLAPIPGAEYALMYVDTTAIAAAAQASFPFQPLLRYDTDFSVAFDAWGGAATASARAPQATTLPPAESPDVMRVAAAAAAPADAIELRTTPWHVGDRASVQLPNSGKYAPGTIVTVSGPLVGMVLDQQQLAGEGLTAFSKALHDVWIKAVPVFEAALSPRAPYSSAGSGQLVVVLADSAARGSGLFFGFAAGVAPTIMLSTRENAFHIVAHEVAHAWQDRFNRDYCGVDTPFACWTGSGWGIEGGADFLAQEAWRRLTGGPLSGWTPPGLGFFACCPPLSSIIFDGGYGSSAWFLRDQVARAVKQGAGLDSALAAVARGSLEGWYGFAPQRPAGAPPRGGLAQRLTALLGTAWSPVDAYETSVWSLGMDESPAPDIYQILAYSSYHFGRVGTISHEGQAIAGTISRGNTFGHVQLADGGAGGTYRFSVGSDGFVWALGRVR